MSMVIESQTARVDYKDYVGDTICVRIGYSEESGINVDLTGYIVTATIYSNVDNGVPLLSYDQLSGKLKTSDPTYNIYFDITSDETTELGEGRFAYAIKLTDPLGYVNTLVNGLILLTNRDFV